MRIVSTHLKGGVGKSTTAIHVSGALLTQGSVLLLDGDQGATSYRFFSGDEAPLDPKPRLISDFDYPLHIAPVRAGTRDIAKAVRATQPDHIVVDTTPKLTEVANTLAELEPDLLLVSVKRDDTGGLTLLPELGEAIRQLGALGIAPTVRVVPIGLTHSEVEPYVDAAPVMMELTPTVPYKPDAAGSAVFEGPGTGQDAHRFIWDLPNCKSFYNLYYDLVFPD